MFSRPRNVAAVAGAIALLSATLLLCEPSPADANETLAKEPADVRVLFVTGGGTYDNSIFRLMETLEGVVTEHVASDVDAFSPGFDGATDVVVLFNVSRSLPENARQRLREFVGQQGGVVVLHHALASYGDWPWWWREVTGGRYVLSPEEGLPASRYTPDASIIARPTRDHPITAPLDGLPIHLYDETYQGLWLSDEIDVLLSTGLASSDGPLLWVGPGETRRVVVFQPGHSSAAHWNLAFRTLLGRAIHWAAGRL